MAMVVLLGESLTFFRIERLFEMVAIVNYDTLDVLPPILSLLLTLKKAGEEVCYIGMESDAGRRFLEGNGIPHVFLPPINRCRANRLVDYICRAPSFLPRRRFLVSVLEQLRKESDNIIVWFQGVQSAALLGKACFNYPKRVLTLFELYDRVGVNWLGFNFDAFVKTSTLVVPEYNRAWILKSILNLAELPFVVANKPCRELLETGLNVPDSIREMLRLIGNKPIFLYQGSLASDRGDVIKILETIAKHRPEYAVVLLSRKTVESDRLMADYSNVYYHPFIPAPHHLAVTSYATVGIAIYSGVGSMTGQLNAIYCAPNKIYEYAAFGVPTLGNNIPGLKYTVETSGAGLCCSIDKESILCSADKLVKEHKWFSANASKFYESCNLSSQISNVLKAVS